MTAGAPAGEGRRYRDLAREAGLTAAVTALQADVCPGALPCGSTGYVLVPSAVEAACSVAQFGRVCLDRRLCHEEVVRIVGVNGETLVALHCRPDRAALAGVGADARPAGDGEDAPPDGDLATRWQIGLAWLRLGLSQRLLLACTRYLSARTTGGVPILAQQMVQGMTADVLVEQLAAGAALEALTDGAPHPEVATEVHRQVTTADTIILRLFGATGFCEEGPGAEAYASELLADVYAWRPAPGPTADLGRVG